jgi:hypothetical protein
MKSFRCLAVGSWVLGLWISAALSPLAFAQGTVSRANFTAGTDRAAKFGVHEIVLTGQGAVANPFDTIVRVQFVPPSGVKGTRTVHAFYDGDNTWRARVYVGETGTWKWSSSCDTDPLLAGKSGSFTAAASQLRGRLLPHPKNPHHWMTEDGRWFLNLNDTAYFLLSPHTAIGEPVKESDVKDYVRDVVAHGITSVRCFTLIGPGGYLEDGKDSAKRWRDSVFADDAFTRLHLPHFRVADDRLRWLLDEYPDLYVQFVLFPRGARYKQDDQMWKRFTLEQKERVMRYLLARYAAYPQVFWLVANDVHYDATHPNNNAFAREVGAYFLKHDPWRHPMSAGHARKVEYLFGGEDWSTYIHLEDNFDLGATQYAKYQAHGEPVFLGEDRYEQDHPEDRDPKDMRYFQRRLFWAWLLAGGSANYGGRWWVVHPYRQTGNRPTPSPWSAIAGGEAGKSTATMHSQQLVGLDSVKAIRDFFTTRKIELSDFAPDHALVKDADGATGVRAPKLMRRSHEEFLIYHPNSAADDRNTRADASKTPGVILDLSTAPGRFTVEWFRALDGTAQPGGVIDGGKPQTLRSPWRGEDCVVRLKRE